MVAGSRPVAPFPIHRLRYRRTWRQIHSRELASVLAITGPRMLRDTARRQLHRVLLSRQRLKTRPFPVRLLFRLHFVAIRRIFVCQRGVRVCSMMLHRGSMPKTPGQLFISKRVKTGEFNSVKSPYDIGGGVEISGDVIHLILKVLRKAMSKAADPANDSRNERCDRKDDGARLHRGEKAETQTLLGLRLTNRCLLTSSR